jgi:hypothetical protein
MNTTHAAAPHYEEAAEVAALVRRFESCALPFAEWTHAAHLTVALWFLLHHDWPDAVALVREGIKRYNHAHGVPTTRERGYHETLTLFWMRHVRAFLADDFNEGRSLPDLANELAASADKTLPLRHYSRELLFSWEARLGWVEPDLKPLPAPRRAAAEPLASLAEA